LFGISEPSTVSKWRNIDLFLEHVIWSNFIATSNTTWKKNPISVAFWKGKLGKPFIFREI